VGRLIPVLGGERPVSDPLRYGASMTVLSQAALGRATLARQMLLTPAERDPVEAIAHLVGLQAQAQFPPYYGLWCRLREFAPECLVELIVDRTVVRVAPHHATGSIRPAWARVRSAGRR
jgi:hypothetical protein